MAKSTILIVDREKILADLLTRALTSEDVAAYGATTADEALRQIAMHPPSLVVVDASIPGGTTLLEDVTKSSSKVLAVSASLTDSERLRAVGITQIVDRNAGLEVLVAAIRRLHETPLKLMGQDGGVHVLVADDEEELRTVLSEFLGMKGYNVRTGKNGFDAVRIVNEDPSIHVVLMDVSMPQMGGMEALRHIMDRSDPPSVIMMTAVADRDVARQAMQSGAFDYILKPFDFVSIDASIMACMSRKDFQKLPWWKRLTRRAL
jgi:DNA-binding NtrC family response regulator